MLDSPLTLLHEWVGFYALTGTAAATLIGLQFVAMSLSMTLQRNQPEKVLRMFVTPTLVHFALVLLVSLLLNMPLPGALWLSVPLVLASLAGLALLVPQRRDVTEAYRHHDLGRNRLLSYLVLPLAAYLLMLAAAFGVLFAESAGFFILAAAMLLLLAIGISNSWDMVLYLARQQREGG